MRSWRGRSGVWELVWIPPGILFILLDAVRAGHGAGVGRWERPFPWNQGMVWIRRNPRDPLIPPPCPGQGHLPPSQGAPTWPWTIPGVGSDSSLVWQNKEPLPGTPWRALSQGTLHRARNVISFGFYSSKTHLEPLAAPAPSSPEWGRAMGSPSRHSFPVTAVAHPAGKTDTSGIFRAHIPLFPAGWGGTDGNREAQRWVPFPSSPPSGKPNPPRRTDQEEPSIKELSWGCLSLIQPSPGAL